MSNRPNSTLLLSATLLLCVLVFFKGLFGSFLFDDFPNLFDNNALRHLGASFDQWLALVKSSDSGVLHRPLSMLSFGLNYVLFGLSPLAFKSTNLIIHLCNGLLIYKLSCRLVPKLSVGSHFEDQTLSRFVAITVTALWLVHPLNISTVLYVVQRMNELASFFMLAGLLCYVEGRLRLVRQAPGLLLGVGGLCLFGTLALLSKENGALIFLYALAIEAICFHFEAPILRQRVILKTVFWLAVALPLAGFALFCTFHPGWLVGGYSGRDFTLTQRLLTEPRVLCDYLLWIIVPSPAWMGIFHDDIAASTGLFHPASTFLSILFWLALSVVAWKRKTRVPGLAFAVAWFLAGHAMESTILPLELVFEHRNYLPMTGLLLGATCAIAPWLNAHLRPRAIVMCCAFLIVVVAGLGALRASDWSSQLRLALAEVKHHPNSPRAQYEAGRAIIFAGTAEGQRESAELTAVPYFERCLALDPTDVYAASSLMLIHGDRGDINNAQVSDLAYRISQVKQGGINPFLVVQTAAIEQKIPLDPAQMKTLVEAALGNPHLSPSMRAMVLDNYGLYLFRVVHNNQAAVGMAMAAAVADPTNPQFQVNLARLAMALGHDDLARGYLNTAKRLDSKGFFSNAIRSLEAQLQGKSL